MTQRVFNRVWLWTWLTILFAIPASRADQPQTKLAIIAETPGATVALDVLTVELSKQNSLQLLERDEIERVRREQGLSAVSRDYLKLGQILGADGLLLMDYTEEAVATPLVGSRAATPNIRTLNVKLVAVKPGVVLAAERFTGITNVLEWARAYARRLEPLLPKLAVLPKDAIPVSVVNLRSAVSSSEAPELERQLQTLTVQRLSYEPQLFVLERQKLQQLAEEKNLSADESAFWNGAWLLEGVVDQSGYSKATVTLNVRLTPAQGGAPQQFEVSGSRTNLAEVINALSARVVAALQITSVVKEWNAAEEAAQFFEEAKWAMRWEVYKQAQSAADAAWALGKRDLECAILRVKARTSQVPGVVPANVSSFKNGRPVNLIRINDRPDTQFCDIAMQALDCYLEFCRMSPDGQPKMVPIKPGWSERRSSDWYLVGIEVLETASRVLQHFNYSPAAQKAAADKLAELRAEARAAAELILKEPSVQDSYFTRGRLATSDELYNTIETRQNIFSCMLDWGCYWQERPEDTVALYRRLMESPVFCYIHYRFWHRDALRPHLVAWNDGDRARIPRVWEDFERELNNSTNVLWRLEARALSLRKIQNDSALGLAFTNFYEEIFSNRVALVANPVAVCDIWSAERLLERGDGLYSQVRDRLKRAYYSDFRPRLEQMKREYWNVTVPNAKASAVFEDQKEFLRENQPYEFKKFVDLFREKTYTQQQAQELLPLLVAYRSNLLAKAELADGPQKSRLQSNARSIEFSLQRHVEKIAHPEAQPQPKRVEQPPVTSSPKPARPVQPVEGTGEFSDSATNIIQVKKFLEIPLDGLSKNPITTIGITAHRMVAGKLLLNLQFAAAVYSSDADGNWQQFHYETIPAIAILDTATERWQVIRCEETDHVQRNPFYHHTTLWRGSVFTSEGGKVQKYDASRKCWVNLQLPDVGNCGLFTVNDRLYAATRDMIVEILEGGDSMRILASNRRQPPVTALDSETLSAQGFVLGTPTLFGGPGETLRVAIPKRISSWDGTDWREVCATPPVARPPLVSDEDVLFFGDGWNTAAGIWRLAVDGDRPELCLTQERQADGQRLNLRPSTEAKPLWKLPQGLTLSRLAAASRGSDVFLMADHSKAENIVNEKERVIIGTKILPQDGYHAELFRFSSNCATPQKLRLKFDHADARPPVSGGQRGAGFLPGSAPAEWLCFGDGRLYFGREIVGIFSAAGRPEDRPRAGVWVSSLEQIDREIERQKKAQDKWQAEVAASTHQAAQRLLERFDLNHDGKIDEIEKVSALANEDFVASHLDQIDTNQNRFVDASELKFFDANTNNVLDATEQAGIEHAQHLLAARLVREFDSDGNGLLDYRELNNLAQSCFDSATAPTVVGARADANLDKWVDVEEVQSLCEQQTSRGLWSRGMPGRPLSQLFPPGGPQVTDARQRFKTLVDNFWQNGGTNTVWQPTRPGFIPPTMPPPARPK